MSVQHSQECGGKNQSVLEHAPWPIEIKLIYIIYIYKNLLNVTQSHLIISLLVCIAIYIILLC